MTDRLNVEIHGAKDAPALLLVHGLLSSNLQWEPNRAVLQEHFRMFEVELWGHGSSPSPADAGAHSIERYVDELDRIRRDHSVARWLVCGQSFSGGIVMRYALARPERTRGIVFTNSRSALAEVGDLPKPLELSAAQRETFSSRRLPIHPCHAKRMPEALKARMEAVADAVDTESLLGCMRMTQHGLSCREVVAELRIPGLLVNGRHERVFQPYRAYAEATMRDLRIVDLDGGHAINVYAPDGFNDAVLSFSQAVG